MRVLGRRAATGWPEARSAPAARAAVAAERALPVAIGVLAPVATVVAAWPLVGAFRGASAGALVVGAAVVAHALAAAPLARRGPRLPAWAPVVASVVLWALAAVLFGTGHPGDVAAVGRGLGTGPARLLSVTLPVSGPRWLLVVPLTLAWCTAAVTGELVRRQRMVPAVGVWAASFAVAVTLTVGAPVPTVGPAVVLVVLAGVVVAGARWLATASLPSSGPSGVSGPWPTAPAAGQPAAGQPAGTGGGDPVPVRPLAVGAVLLGVTAAVVAVAVPAVPGLSSPRVRPDRQPPVLTVAPVMPTDEMATLRDRNPGAPAVPELSVRTSGPVDGYVALAYLDRYDGGNWQLNRTFVPSGGRVPAPPGTPAGGRLVTEHVTVLHRLPGPWLAVDGRPTDVSGTTVDYAPGSAMVVPATPLVPGDRYTVRARVTDTTLGALGPAALTRPPAPDPADVGLPASVQPYIGAVVRDLAAEAGTTPSPGLGFLASVLRDLHQHDTRLVVGTSRAATAGAVDEGGTSFAAVVHAVLTAHQATPEQFATLFALVARAEGYPARLVTGFRDPGVAGHPMSGVLTDRQAWTWVELPVSGLGWVVADPTPGATGTPTVPAVSASAPTRPPAPAQGVGVSGHSGHALAAPVRLHRRGAGEVPWVAVGVGAAVAVAALPALAVLRRWRRRRRRRRGPPGEQVVGAWHEVLDTLAEARCADLVPLTATEVVVAARRRLGQDAADATGEVAGLADRVVFSSGPPTEGEAAQAWEATSRLRAACRRGLPAGARVRAAVTVAPRSR